VFYTPAALVERVVDETLGPALARARRGPDGVPALRVLDPACGDGRFLVACRDRLAAAGVPRQTAVTRCLVGVDVDPAAAALARQALGPGADVRVGEALLGGVIEPGAWDVIVGNPPYVRSVRLKAEDPALWARLRRRFEATSHGEWDLYAAFVEASLTWAAPGGEIGLVVPSRWLSARAAERLRAHLAARRAVRRVVDFGARQVMDGPTTYTCLLFLRAAPVDEVAVEREDGAGSVAASALGGAPWVLTSRRAARRLERLRAAGPALGAIARVAKGAGTNADDVFLVPADAAAGRGEAVRVPCVRGRDVVPWGLVPARDALLPYDGERLLGPEELRRLAPSAAAHLAARRAPLEARERGRFAGAAYYRWGRPQNLVWLRDPAPKVIVPDAARAGRAALDREGRLVIDTAYAVRPLEPGVTPVGLLLAVLNAPIVAEWLGQAGVPLRGGYFRMKTAYLASLPVPDPARRAARAIAEDALVVGPDDAGAHAELARRVMALYA
jgi:methylase of polypeptide subunit release factors